MKMLFDLFPVVLFFAAFKFWGIFVATGVAMGASVVQIGVTYLLKRKVEATMWVGFGVIAVFGGSTLLLHNEMFIKWKPTILYWLFAGAIFGAKLLYKKNVIRGMMGKQLVVPDAVWEWMNVAWGVFFGLIGAVNLFVAYTFPTPVWVNFKLFGIMGLMLLFIIAQGFFLAPYVKEDTKDGRAS